MKANITIGSLVFKCESINLEMNDMSMNYEYDKDEVIVIAEKFYNLFYGNNEDEEAYGDVAYDYDEGPTEDNDLPF